MAPHTSNLLGESTSPYLLQHAGNPVDWRPWGLEAFAEAAERDLPVMVSIGYSTCHWCHVMAAESFSDPALAQQLRDTAVAIKVDREELPGVDSYFMDALLAMRSQGGWPLTAFTTPEGKPFFAGTYFPEQPRHGMPSFSQVLTAIGNTWRDQREKAEQIAASLDEKLSRFQHLEVGLPAESGTAAPEVPLPDADTLDAAVGALLAAEDPDNGGFGTSPKFPPTMNLINLLRHRDRILAGAAGAAADRAGEAAPAPTASEAVSPGEALACVRRAFAGMAAGGMRDQVAGGIARYSVDARWHVPHFEKMLYDNALYLRAATAWHRAERALDPLSRCARLAEREARDTAEFLLAELQLPQGGFAAALDADSRDDRGEHSEGAYYLEADLPEDAAEDSPFALLEAVDAADPARAHPVGMPVIREWMHAGAASADDDPAVPWETAAARAVRRTLSERRAQRARPGRDDKLVSEWNALAVSALALAGEEFDEVGWTRAAIRARDAVLRDNVVSRSAMSPGAAPDQAEADRGSAGRLIRSSTDGVPGPGGATLADVAGMLSACLLSREAGEAPAGAHAPGASEQSGPESGTGDHPWAGAGAQAAHLLAQALSFVRAEGSEEGARRTFLFDTSGDEIVPPQGSDPLDNSQPSGRSALAEALRLVEEHGISGGELHRRPGPNGTSGLGGTSEPGAIPGLGGVPDPAGEGRGDVPTPGDLRRLLVFSSLPVAQQAARSMSWMLAEAELLAAAGGV